MLTLRRVSSTALSVLSIMLLGAVTVHAVPISPGGEHFGLPVVTPINALIANDDVFSIIDLTTLVNPATTATQHYGPYKSGSTDSGTCGNDWAQDTFNRHFTVFQQPDGSIQIVEQFKNGTFTTPASDSPKPNFSPGACQTSPTPQGIIKDGVKGTLHGYFIVPLPAGTMQTSKDPHCDAVAMSNTDCTTTKFIDTHFTPYYGAGVCTVTTFFFHYVAASQHLIENEWKNASADRGGNQGDIRSKNI